jgi:hypothetical protein
MQSCAGARLCGERLPKRAPLHGVWKVIGFRYSVGGTNAEQWEHRIGIVEPPLDPWLAPASAAGSFWGSLRTRSRGPQGGAQPDGRETL